MPKGGIVVGTQPLISILIPAYNAAATLPRCLDSASRQTYSNLEIVVLNDGSADDTATVLARYARTDGRIRVLYQPNAGNLARTRNALLDAANGAYFTFFDSDDYAEPQFVERLYQTMLRFTAELAVCGFRIQAFPFPILQVRRPKERCFQAEDAICRMILGKEMHFMLWNKLFRTDIAENLRFDPAVRYGEDLVFCYRYLRRCSSVAYTDAPLYHYLTHADSQLRSPPSAGHMTLFHGLEALIAEETDTELLSCLRAWRGFSACLLWTAARRGNTLTEPERHLLASYAKAPAVELLAHRATRSGYKWLYRLLHRHVLRSMRSHPCPAS